jgi:hypothetical protein
VYRLAVCAGRGDPVNCQFPGLVVHDRSFFGPAASPPLGKGIAAASLAAILASRGIRVTNLKLDPYINVDPER